jgi:hypothetical protein
MSFCSDHVFLLRHRKSSAVSLPGASDTRVLWLNIQETRKLWSVSCEDIGTLSDQGQGRSVKLTETACKAKAELVRIFVAFCKNRKYISVFRRARDWTAILSQISPIYVQSV